MIDFQIGEPFDLKPGMLLVYSCGKVELVGSQKHVATGPVVKWTQVVEPHWIEWAQDIANRRGH